MDKVRVIELFAGVGGFRVGLDRADSDFFKTIWANQWEPATKVQHAAMVYEKNFGPDSVVNEDINQVKTEDIPDHDMLVGGFPCQDYSVARPLAIPKVSKERRVFFGGPSIASLKRKAKTALPSCSLRTLTACCSLLQNSAVGTLPSFWNASMNWDIS